MQWQSNQVVSIFGKKRSGKSQFAKTVIWPNINNIICYDRKYEHSNLNVPIAHTLEAVQQLWDSSIEKIVYQPWNTSADDCNELAHMVFQRGNTTLWIDELASVSTPLKYPYYLGECIRLGQIRGIGIVLVSQRPALIPSLAISEADIIVAFRLQLFNDAEKIAAVMGEQFIPELMHLESYYFFIYDFEQIQACSPLTISASEANVPDAWKSG